MAIYKDVDAIIAKMEFNTRETWGKGLNTRTERCWEECVKVKDNIIKLMKEEPAADVVEVVRCKDCKLRYTDDCLALAWDCGELMGDTEDNDFCSQGKRTPQKEG